MEREPIRQPETHSSEVVVFDASWVRERDMRHNKNLHGDSHVDGLTGFYHGNYYDRGTPRPAKRDH